MTCTELLELSKALLTPLVAIVATYIAWQQWKTNRLKLKLDRYDRRFKVYEEIQKILSIIRRDGKASYDDLLNFRTSVAQADFLFEPEIADLIAEIYRHGVKLMYWTEQYRDYTQDRPPGYDNQKITDGMKAELNWLDSQFEPVKEKFQRYLRISD
jgi:hypothetical protein